QRVGHRKRRDFIRWRDEGRYDILHIIRNEGSIWVGDHLISSRNGHSIQRCPFLIMDDNGLYSCTIYETRPAVCRNFEPGVSRMCPQYEEQ
ncbi:MAG: YkgJ family cysteine cluster protein, partial [Spirochaetota bacterium]